MTTRRSGRYGGAFTAKLFRWEGPGAWVFATVPDRYAPPVTHAWGRTPVHAVVDGYEWRTSVWRAKNGSTVIAVPKRARGGKDDGDRVKIQITFSTL